MTDVDPVTIPPVLTGADPLSPEALRADIDHLKRITYQNRERTGGDDDAIEEIQIGELYESGIESATISELERQFDDPWQPHIEKVWDKRPVTDNFTAGPYGIYMIGQGAKLTLPEYPDVDSEVICISDDDTRIRVNGNGNDIKVKKAVVSEVEWRTAGKSVRFIWFETGPYWVAI